MGSKLDIVSMLVIAFASQAVAFDSPYGLMTERLTDPIGIDVCQPRISWKNGRGLVRQTAYEIEADGWRSGKVVSSQQVDVLWAGSVLRSSSRVNWRVRVWNERGECSPWSDRASFVTGLLRTDEWTASWIGGSSATVDFSQAKWVEGEVLTKDFLASGTSYDLVVTALRPFTVKVNGAKAYSWTGHAFRHENLRFVSLRGFVHAGATNRVEILGGSCTLAVLRTGDDIIASSDADWGGHPRGGAYEPAFAKGVDFREERVSPAFEKTFQVSGRIRSAFLHVTGLGFYEASLNGARIGKKVLDPSPTDYDKRVLYSTYDLKEILANGENVLRIVLGHGWYDMRTAATWNFDSAPWRDRPKAIAQLEIEYEDGRRERIVTDATWRQVANPVAYDCLREGEIAGALPVRLHADARAAVVPGPKGRLACAAIPGARIDAETRPKEIRRLRDGRVAVTFPESIAGWCRFAFRGLSAGAVVTIRYDENLGADGEAAKPSAANPGLAKQNGEGLRRIDCFFELSSSHRFLDGDGAMQTDRFVASGLPVETFEPRFVYHGFRHVILDGLAELPRPDDVIACLVRTHFPETGEFACSDGRLTELVRMAKNSYKANFTDGIPTDCPHREKLGWTGDAWIASELGQCYFENTAGYEKWLQDVLDTQTDAGEICCIAPTGGWGYAWGNGPVFDAVLGMLPWNLWLFRADARAVQMAYPALDRYLAYAKTRETAPGLVANGLGDWNARDRSLQPSNEYVISCLYLRLREIAAEMARLLGRVDDAARHAADARRTREALEARFYRGEGVYDNGRQTAQALAVALNLGPVAARDLMASKLVEAVEATGRHYDCGLVGSKFVYRALSAVGRDDLALAMILNPTEPSMTKWIGQTGTLWEDWTSGLSKCHVMLGDFAAWTMEYVAGLRRPLAPGCSRMLIEPSFVTGLSWARAATETPYGRYSVSWKRLSSGIELEVEVPPGAEAEVRLPEGSTRDVSSGRSHFVIQNKVTSKGDT